MVALTPNRKFIVLIRIITSGNHASSILRQFIGRRHPTDARLRQRNAQVAIEPDHDVGWVASLILPQNFAGNLPTAAQLHRVGSRHRGDQASADHQKDHSAKHQNT